MHQAHRQKCYPRSAELAPRSHRDNAPAPSAPRSHTAPVLRLSVAGYHLEHRRRRNTRSTSRQTAESKAPDSSEPRAPPRGNDLLLEELEEGQVDYEESVASEAQSNAASARSHTSGVSSGAASARSYGSTTMSPPRRVLRTPNPFAERYNPVRALCDAPPLTSRYEEDRSDPNTITNDLDEDQSRQLSTEPSSQRSNRPTARPLTLPSRCHYGFQPLDPAKTARRAALQLLDTYACGPSTATAGQQLRRHTLRERFLTQQVTTPRGYRERLQQQLHGQPVPAMQTVPVVIRPGEATTAYEAQFQNWVERARRLPSYEALRASLSETDIRLERRLRLDFAKLKARRQLPGTRPKHHEAPPAPASSTAAHVHEPAAPATGQSLSSAADLSSPRSSGGKRSAPGDAVARRDGDLATGVPGHKRQRRLGNPAGGEPRTPMNFVNEGNLATPQDIGYDPGDDAAPQGVPCDSGTHHARRAEPAEDEPRLDPRAASHHDMIVLDQRVRSLSTFVHDANASHARLAEDLEEMHRRVDWFETPSALQNRVVDLERQVAQLQGQLDLLLRLQPYDPRPVAPPLAVVQPPAAQPPSADRRQRPHAHLSRVLVRLE
ncbi:hypothetical protein PI124_g22878 [Phytophthora idaei]|nr:hypothetical protein PI125_g24851 [Phytophthora idaei]KAG3125497.1 hypothetical protein PI126_g22736 [Phytophthora idaei]KAG3232032.1 hypothetical protein PI124_g22878 [Phytophthora idaei]